MIMTQPDEDEDIDKKYDLDWTNVPEEKAREVFALGQEHLKAQLQTALAADGRATATAGLCVTLGLATLAAGLGYWQAKGSWAILGGSLSATAFFLWAAFRAADAAQPINFFLPGTQPRRWFKSIYDDDLATLLGGQAEIDDRDIRRNAETLRKNADKVKGAFALSVIAPVVGLAVWAVIPLFLE